MTAWWNSTTSVRKVRVRSIEAFRTLAFGAALVSADATEVEIVVMCAPGRVVGFRCCYREPDSASNYRATRRANSDPGPSRFRRKSRPIVEIGQPAASKNPDRLIRDWNQLHRSKLDRRFRTRRQSRGAKTEGSEGASDDDPEWALIFFLVSIVAVFGFTDISAASAEVARFLFYVFV